MNAGAAFAAPVYFAESVKCSKMTRFEAFLCRFPSLISELPKSDTNCSKNVSFFVTHALVFVSAVI